MNWVRVADKLKIIDFKNINLDIKINPLCNLVFRLILESPIIFIVFMVYSSQRIY